MTERSSAHRRRPRQGAKRPQTDLFEPCPRSIDTVAGVDEAGRGPLAGPVVAAAVILSHEHGIRGLDDSKKLTPETREALAQEIRQHALAHAVAFVSAADIDRINILQATMRAMANAVLELPLQPSLVLVDGNRCPPLAVPARAEIRGDGRFECIAAASILAKVERDRYMCEMDRRYPGYGFARHKGYGTKAHLDALERLGATDQHRVSFAPVRKWKS